MRIQVQELLDEPLERLDGETLYFDVFGVPFELDWQSGHSMLRYRGGVDLNSVSHSSLTEQAQQSVKNHFRSALHEALGSKTAPMFVYGGRFCEANDLDETVFGEVSNGPMSEVLLPRLDEADTVSTTAFSHDWQLDFAPAASGARAEVCSETYPSALQAEIYPGRASASRSMVNALAEVVLQCDHGLLYVYK